MIFNRALMCKIPKMSMQQLIIFPDIAQAVERLRGDVSEVRRNLKWICAPSVAARAVAYKTLPKIVSNSELYGTVASGCLKDTPICGCIGDQQAATLGQRCKRGEAKNTYGTGM